MPAFAHTIISFEIAGAGRQAGPPGRERRRHARRRDEKYNPLKGSARQYELMYVVADERDVIQ